MSKMQEPILEQAKEDLIIYKISSGLFILGKDFLFNSNLASFVISSSPLPASKMNWENKELYKGVCLGMLAVVCDINSKNWDLPIFFVTLYNLLKVSRTFDVLLKKGSK